MFARVHLSEKATKDFERKIEKIQLEVNKIFKIGKIFKFR